jgi:hypothetical protein
LRHHETAQQTRRLFDEPQILNQSLQREDGLMSKHQVDEANEER